MKNHEEVHELIKIPAEITSEDLPVPSELSSFYKDGLFWPGRFSQTQLATYRKILGSYGAAGQLQQRPAPAEGGLVKREWFVELDPITLQRDITDHPINFYLDTADTKDENQQGNDYTAILTAYRKDNYVFIVDVVQVKKQFFELCKFIPEYTTKHYYTNNSKIKVEPKSSGRSIVSQLKSTTMLNIVELTPPKDDKMTRLMAIQPLLESGRVKLIKGNYTKDFLDQLCMFPNAQNDDMVDTLIYAVTDLLMESDFDFMFT
jgi:predicted phage terminase large subunit-like protein